MAGPCVRKSDNSVLLTASRSSCVICCAYHRLILPGRLQIVIHTYCPPRVGSSFYVSTRSHAVLLFFFFLMTGPPQRSPLDRSRAASGVKKSRAPPGRARPYPAASRCGSKWSHFRPPRSCRRHSSPWRAQNPLIGWGSWRCFPAPLRRLSLIHISEPTRPY